MKTPEYVKSVFDLYETEFVYKAKLSEEIKEAVKVAYIVHALWNYQTSWSGKIKTAKINKENCLYTDFISVLV